MAYDFDGTGDFLSYGSLTSLNGLTTMTVAGWVQMDTLTADGGILCTRNSVDTDGFLFFYDDAAAASGRTDTFGFFLENGTTQVRIEGATGAATTGVWQHVCVTFLAGSSTGIRLYVNGVEDANSPSSSIGITNSGASANVQLQIGNANDFTRDIDGKLAEVAGWNRVLSAEEVAALAKGFSPKFLPGLAFYAPLVRDDADVVSGTDASVNGTPSVFPHPPIIYPARPSAVQVAGAAAGGVTIEIPQGDLALPGSAPEALLGSATIPAVVYDGMQGYLLHTGGPAGVSDGAELTVVWAGTFNSDGSAMVLLDIPGTVPVQLIRQSDNTIDFVGGTSGAVFSNSTTAVAASLGFLIVLASCDGTSSTLKVVHAAGTITGTNTPGSAVSLDLTTDWFLGSDGGAADFLDADTSLWWANDLAIDFTDADNIEQFWDTTADLLRDPGADGSNPVDGAYSPLVFHGSPASTHVVNGGTGGDADTAGTFADGTNPGFYSVDFDAGGALIVFGKGELVLDGKAPTPVATTHRTIILPQGDLVLDGKTPVPSTAAAAIVTPGSGDLALSGQAPTVTAEEHRTIVLQAGSLLLEGEAPEPLAENHLFTAPGAGDLALDGKAPTATVALPSHTIAVGQGNILLFGFAPTVVDSSAPVVIPSQPRPGPAGSGFTARRDYDEVDRIVRQVREVYAELRKDVPADSAAAVEIAAAVAEYVAPDAPDVPPASEVDWAALGADGLVAVERLLMLLLAMERAFQEVRARRLAEMQEEEDMEILMMVA